MVLDGTTFQKKERGKVFRLWGRCDACHLSGPFERFIPLYRREQSCVICDVCFGDETLWLLLCGDGWAAL
jgi:hypothetical protein